MDKWDQRWLELAQFVSRYSKDPSTKVGAVVAKGKDDFAFGYNGFPASCPDDLELYTDRDTKYKLVTHAEVNAVFKAMQKGRDVDGATVYTYPLAPCATCSSLLASLGISRVVSLIDPSASSSPTHLDTSPAEFVLKMNNIEWEWIYAQ